MKKYKDAHGKRINRNAVIHHRNYDNICRFNENKNGIPCCERCKLNNPEYFNGR